MKDTYTIGKLASSAGVNVQTVRYYERSGLIKPSSKSRSGYRIYGKNELNRLRFILHAKRLGFTLREIKELLDLRVDVPSACDNVREKAEEKLKVIKERIASLEDIKDIIEKLVASCRARRPTDGCPILESIEKGK